MIFKILESTINNAHTLLEAYEAPYATAPYCFLNLHGQEWRKNIIQLVILQVEEENITQACLPISLQNRNGKPHTPLIWNWKQLANQHDQYTPSTMTKGTRCRHKHQDLKPQNVRWTLYPNVKKKQIKCVEPINLTASSKNCPQSSRVRTPLFSGDL